VRQPRIKAPTATGDSIYHCVSRTVNGAFLFDDLAKETLRKHLRQVADFCGVQILTYAILSNHFHVLVRIPRSTPISDDELLRRYKVLHPSPTRHQQATLATAEAWLRSGAPEGAAWRQRQLALMGDVSAFMKLLKQRFSIWFNHAHGRYGTLWSERFKSVLIESRDRVVEIVAAYIDLNAVRAGLVSDPKDYRFCGYGEAVAGGKLAQAGLRHALGSLSWQTAQADYRQTLYGVGSAPRDGAASLSLADLEKVVRARGRLAPSAVLRCRIRHFSDGAVLGARAFVARHLRGLGGRRADKPPRDLPDLVDWGTELATLHGLRRRGTT
jgi:REP element-mobilizing transposase RayT